MEHKQGQNLTAVATVEWMDFKNYIGNCFYINDKWCDVCLISSEGATINCHYLILAAASDFFKKILTEEKQIESLTKMIIPDINYKILKCIVGYIYTGEIALNTDELEIFLEGCNLLSIKGITDVENIIEDNVEPVQEPVQQITTTTSALYNVQIMETEELDQNDAQTIEPIPTMEIEEDIDQPDEYELIKREIEHDSNNDYDDQNGSELGDENQLTEILPDSYTESGDIVDESLMDTSKKNEIYYVLQNSIKTHPGDDGVQIASSSQMNTLKFEEDMKMKRKPKEYPNLKEAIDTIVDQGLSYANASKQYDIPKYILFRQVRKMNVSRYYKFDAIKDVVHKEMEQGETLTSISQKYNIPISTLHRYKVKLSTAGILSDALTPKTQRRKEEKVQLIKSIESMIKSGLSQTEIAKKMEIPKTTLWRLIKNGEHRNSKAHSSQMLTAAAATTVIPKTENIDNYYVVSGGDISNQEASSTTDNAECRQMLAQILKTDNC